MSVPDGPCSLAAPAARLAAALCLAAAPCLAQQARPATLALDTSALVSESVDAQGNRTTGVVLDAFVSAGLGRGFEVMARPFLQHLPSGEWNRQVWVAAVRFEHRGPVGLRVEAGLITPPVGLANLTLRPHLVPTLTQPATLFEGLPAVSPGSPRLTLLGAIYPYGVSATVSRPRWDVRAAVMDTSPLRARRVFAPSRPPHFRNVVLGGGVTPFVGLRIGASVTRGGWLRAGEIPTVTEDQDATVATVEAEVAYRHTKLTGEWVRNSLALGGGETRRVTGWFAQGQQALGPRWFAAGRVERISAGRLVAPQLGLDPEFTNLEEAIGYRLSPDLTLRAGHRARRTFGRTAFAHEALASVVWSRRWM